VLTLNRGRNGFEYASIGVGFGGKLSPGVMGMNRNREKAKTGTEKTKAPGTLLTLAEACQLLHVHGNTLRRWNAQGIVKAYRIGPGRHRRFEADDITGLLAEQAKQHQVNE
jgi:excisionase family DNA binding protein